MIFIEAADMLLPAGSGDVRVAERQAAAADQHCQDWFGDPAFMNGGDSVVLIAESRQSDSPARLATAAGPDRRDSLARHGDRLALHQPLRRTAERKPQIVEHAGRAGRLHRRPVPARRAATAGGAAYADPKSDPKDLIDKVEEFIQAQVGEDVVEFKKPSHTLDDVVGCYEAQGIPGPGADSPLQGRSPDKALPGAAVAGPIGGGKTFLFEAVAGELGVPVLVLKNIRSQWFGQTDVIFERLRRVLEALEKVVIFVDEADTQFGGVGAETHATERRLTGKIQAMMSDPKLRGKVMWLLMTARIHLLSPDIRRPGRVGDLIIPVLDPVGPDRRAFVEWVLRAVVENPSEPDVQHMDELTQGYSAAAFASLRSQLKAAEVNSMDQIVAIVRDHIPPAIGLTRRYQTLQAMVNCTRRSLMPDPNFTEKDREAWQMEIRQLESLGIR